MTHDRASFLQTLKSSYEAYYNLHEDYPSDGLPLAFRADFFSRDERFWITKSIPIWANETNEYLYLFSAAEYTPELVDKCIDFALNDGLPLVKPHKEHQYTNIICVFIGDNISDECAKAIKARSFNKSYNHSLHGFTMLKSIAVDLSTEKLVTNSAGHDLKSFYKKLFKSLSKKKQ